MAYQQQTPTGESQRRFAMSRHHTSQMALPRILRDGELPPIITRPEPTAETERLQEEQNRPQPEPEVIAANVLAFQNKNPDPLASVISSFTPKPSKPSRQITSPVRYYLDTDLFLSIEPDQIEAQKARMMETGRWRLPNNGGRYTIRIDYYSLPKFARMPERVPDWEQARSEEEGRSQRFLDFDMDGDKLVETTEVVRRHKPGASLDERQWYIDHAVIEPTVTGHFNEDTLSIWWEKDSWLCARVNHVSDAGMPTLADDLLDVLVIVLQDRSVHVVESEPRPPSKKWKRSGLYSPEQDVAEIAMYCPRRISIADHGGTHASPRMHYRAEHLRQQAHGPNRSFRKEIVIEAQWINAADVDPSELPPSPPRSYRLRA
jgi:hypothetical protein